MNFKRKRDTDQEAPKKAALGEKEKMLWASSNDWPLYNHPEGGTVKITPWGLLRQYENPQTGEMCTKFEDTSFSEMSFVPQTQSLELPTTPMSLNMLSSLRASPGPQISPETEQYVLDGYGRQLEDNSNQYGQEQENLFGIEDEDCSEHDVQMS